MGMLPILWYLVGVPENAAGASWMAEKPLGARRRHPAARTRGTRRTDPASLRGTGSHSRRKARSQPHPIWIARGQENGLAEPHSPRHGGSRHREPKLEAPRGASARALSVGAP